MLLAMQPRTRTPDADGRVVLRARVHSRAVEALDDEAFHRRVAPGVLLDEILAATLPTLAERRVAERIAPARALRLVADDEGAEAVPPIRGGPG